MIDYRKNIIIEPGTVFIHRIRRDGGNKAIRNITTKDICWAAGFIEGEGCISKHKINGAIRIFLAQVNKEPIDKLKEIFGGRIRIRYRNKQNIKHKDQYEWTVYGS